MTFAWLSIACLFLLNVAVLALYDGFDFVFPKGDYYNAPRVMLLTGCGKPLKELPTDAFTITFYVLTDEQTSNPTTLISYSSVKARNYNEFYLEVSYAEDDDSKDYTALRIGSAVIHFDSAPSFGEWTHVAISWSSEPGEVRLHIDGVKMNSTFKYEWMEDELKRYEVGGDGYFVFGNDQDGYDSSYDYTEGLIGRMAGFKMFERVLTDDEVGQVMNCTREGELVDWSDSQWGFYGGVTLQESTAPCGKTYGEEDDDEDDTETSTTPPPGEIICGEPTSISKYDPTSPFADGLPHKISATLKNIALPELKAFTMCFHLSGKLGWYNMTFWTINDEGGAPLMEFGFDANKGIYFTVDSKTEQLPIPLSEGFIPMCLTWSSTSGHLAYFVNWNNIFDTTDLGKSFLFPANSKIVITQEKVAEFDPKHPEAGYYYKTSDISFWDRELSEQEVTDFGECTGKVPGCLFTSKEAEWDVKDLGPVEKPKKYQ